MGYRNKIAILEISKLEAIKDMTYEEILKAYGKNDHVACYTLAEEVYEVGKLIYD